MVDYNDNPPVFDQVHHVISVSEVSKEIKSRDYTPKVLDRLCRNVYVVLHVGRFLILSKSETCLWTV